MILPGSPISAIVLFLSAEVIAGTSVKAPWMQQQQRQQQQKAEDLSKRYNLPVKVYTVNTTRVNAVKQAFEISWDGYFKYAFPHDSLRPVTNTWSDDRNGWGASAVDALSTALIMGSNKAVGQIVDYIPKINFDNTTTPVSLFETTIRYLGGLISAYDLLTGPLSGTFGPSSKWSSILAQAKHLADNLSVGFATPSGVPDNNLLFNPPRTSNSASNGIATIGTLVLEWTRLSDLTGDRKYGLLAQKGEEYLLHPRNPALGEPFPGLLGTDVSLADGRFLDGNGGWGAGTDSFYEYLIKMYLYDPVRFGEYKERWVAAAESSIKHMVSHPTSRPDLTYLAMWRGNATLDFVSQHLACFGGGNFILGGLTLDEPRYVRFGLSLVDSCYQTYRETATGIGPEIFRWQDSLTAPDAPNNAPPPANQKEFYSEAGFWITSSHYVLRPEVVESIYYAYRATGDPKYQQWAWDAFLAVNKTCAVGSGYSSIANVNEASGGGYTNFQESFWFAEVLKYSYLIHAADSPWQVKADHSNQFVYNTEAHPVRIFSGRERTGRGQKL